MTTGARKWLASGAIGNEKRMKPYAPSLSMIAASTTEPPVGASTCASGSHVWTGHIGTLTANAAKNAKNSSGSCCHVAMWKLPPALYQRKMIATSVSSEPANEYRKNLIDA